MFDFLKTQQCCIQELNHDYLSNLHQGAILNEYHMWKKCHKTLQWEFYGEIPLQIFK